MLVLFPSKKHKNSSVAMAMQRFFEFFRRKNYGALWNNLFNFFHLLFNRYKKSIYSPNWMLSVF